MILKLKTLLDPFNVPDRIIGLVIKTIQDETERTHVPMGLTKVDGEYVPVQMELPFD